MNIFCIAIIFNKLMLVRSRHCLFWYNISDVAVCISLPVSNCITRIEPSIVISSSLSSPCTSICQNLKKKLHMQWTLIEYFSFLMHWEMNSSFSRLHFLWLWMTFHAFFGNQPDAEKNSRHMFAPKLYLAHVTDCIKSMW